MSDTFNKIKQNLSHYFVPYWQHTGFTVQLIYLSGSRLNGSMQQMSDWDLVVVCENLPQQQIYYKLQVGNQICSVFFHDSFYYINPISCPNYYASGLVDFLHLTSPIHECVLYYQNYSWVSQFIRLTQNNKDFIIHNYFVNSQDMRDQFVEFQIFTKELYHCVDALFLKHNYKNLEIIQNIKYEQDLSLLTKLLHQWMTEENDIVGNNHGGFFDD